MSRQVPKAHFHGLGPLLNALNKQVVDSAEVVHLPLEGPASGLPVHSERIGTPLFCAHAGIMSALRRTKEHYVVRAATRMGALERLSAVGHPGIGRTCMQACCTPTAV